MQVSDREYKALRAHKDFRRCTTYKKRRCFTYGDRYYQLDIYEAPLPPQCPSQSSLILLETYTTNTDGELPGLPTECLEIVREITHDPAYSMYNMSLRHDAAPGLAWGHKTAQPGGRIGTASPQTSRKVTAPVNSGMTNGGTIDVFMPAVSTSSDQLKTPNQSQDLLGHVDDLYRTRSGSSGPELQSTGRKESNPEQEQAQSEPNSGQNHGGVMNGLL